MANQQNNTKLTLGMRRFTDGILPRSTYAPLGFTGAFAFAVVLAPFSGAQELLLAEGPGAYKRMTLEELMEQEVTTVSRKPERRAGSASAVHVITANDIRISGATSIPEALRFAPGVQVARVNNHTWAISIRGFSSTTANKLQVLMDGRTLYSPLFSGVFWDVQDTLMEDIDRIEVIRGPGASMWGANAVNGIINIITKSAKETQGVMMMGGAGSEERGFGGVRYGGEISENAHYRVYAKYFDRDESVLANGLGADDDWQQGQTGFRIDWDANERNSVTFQGDAYMGEKRELVILPLSTGPAFVSDDTTLSGANLLTRWTHSFQEGSEMTTRLYYDHSHRSIPNWFEETRHTADLDWQHRVQLGDRNDFLYGFNYNITTDDLVNSYAVSWQPTDRTRDVISAFVHNQFSLIPDRLDVSVGARVEHNDYTGVEFQPNGRLAFRPTENQTLWASVARAVRTPSRIDGDIQLRAPAPGPTGSQDVYLGNPNFRSEEVVTHELGYRVRPHAKLSLDFTAFYSIYENLRSVESGPVTTSGGIQTRTNVIANNLEGTTYGGSVAVQYELAEWWALTLGYTYLELDLQTKRGSTDTSSVAAQEGSDPTHQLFALSSIDLPHNISFDTSVRFVDELPALNIPSYVALDLQVRWRPNEQLELAIGGRNLLDDQHPEFSSALRNEIERSVYGKVTWRF